MFCVHNRLQEEKISTPVLVKALQDLSFELTTGYSTPKTYNRRLLNIHKKRI
jgi:hypothetical protein